MKIKILNIHPVKYALAATIFGACAVQAQTFDTTSYRGQTGTESAQWYNSFTNAYLGANHATATAAGGSLLADASIVQSLSGFAPPPMIIDVVSGEATSSGGIYGGSAISQYSVSYANSAGTFAGGIGNVTLQIQGSTFDPNSAMLNYGSVFLSPTSYSLFSGDSDEGTYEWSWNLPLSDDVTAFSISFNAASGHSFLEGAALDVSSLNAAPVPEPGTLAVLGLGGLTLMFARRFRNQKTA